MYRIAYDEAALALVVVHAPGGLDEEGDFAHAIRALERLADASRSAEDRPGRVLYILKDGIVAPSPEGRIRHGDALRRHGNVRLVLVTRSPMHRAFHTALGQTYPDYRARSTTSATVEEALAWLAHGTGEDGAVLRRLLARAEADTLRAEQPALR